MTTALKRIEREPLWDLAHAQLRDALLAGRFEPGTVLTLRALAESFGTSITPVRDAVTRLVAQGVLQQGPRNSAIVPNLTRKELADLTVVRCALEGRAAREAALHRHDDAALRRLAGAAGDDAIADQGARARELSRASPKISFRDLRDVPHPAAGRNHREHVAALRPGAVLRDPRICRSAEGMGSSHRRAEGDHGG